MSQSNDRARLAVQDPYFGFVRTAAAVTHVRLADPFYNLGRHLRMLSEFARHRVDVGQFGELSLTGYSCGRYFQQAKVRRDAREALIELNRASKDIFPGVVIAGAPLEIDDGLYNCAIAMCRGRFLGISVKRFPPNYEEFLELKVFSLGKNVRSRQLLLDGQKVPVGTNLIFDCQDVPDLKVGLPICEDDWVPGASSYFLAANGATLLCSTNGSDELVGKEDYRQIHQVVGLSARCIAGYTYSSQGPGESTSDVAFSGYLGIADNGSLQAEIKPLSWVDTFGDPERLGESMIFADVDLDHIKYDRLRTVPSWAESAGELARMRPARHVPFTLERPATPRPLARKIDLHPYVPANKAKLDEVCRKIVKIKLAGDITRLVQVGNPPVWVAVSGGLDSTARLLDAYKVKLALHRPVSEVHAVTMPGFGTGKRTYKNVVELCRLLGVSFHEVDIRPLCWAIMLAMGMKPFGMEIGKMTLEEFIERLKELPKDAKDLGFENVQAHVRTLIITRFGFAFGTSDMSEQIIGWCTWLADQLGGHYNSQATMAKTLVRFQVQHEAETEFDGAIRARLLDICDTEVSAELLPTGKDGEVRQKTDDTNGPEEVRDFFMRYFRRYGDTPEKILYLVQEGQRQGGFKRLYSQGELIAWWQRFAARTVGQRFKNACRTDGAQVGSDCLSPHGNWVVPSDASPQAFLLPEGFDLAPFFKEIDRQVASPSEASASSTSQSQSPDSSSGGTSTDHSG